MNRATSMLETARHLASDAFWQDDAPLALAAPGEPPPAALSAAPPGHVLFATSGSSGAPKWVALSKPALMASATAVNSHLEAASEAVWGLALPVHHVGGFGVVARARALGRAPAVFPGPWNAAAFAQWARDHPITHTSLVPAQVHDLTAINARAPENLRAVVVGGGRLDEAAGRAARALGWPVLASYGMTEAASQIATQPPAALHAPYQPWPIPVLPHWDARVDAAGCLEIRGPALFSGVLEAGVYHPRPGEWHATRDLARLSPDGITPLGRADLLVKIAGELVDPTAVEARLATALGTPAGAFAVVPVADERLGSRLVAVAGPLVSDHELREALEAHNATVPRSQRVGGPLRMDELPRGALGKIRRAELAERVARMLT